ncbi:MAG: pyrimidine/purine nucleoside phosphorylase [Nevskiales bacterium]
MLKVNEYFDGNVKSISFTAGGLNSTVGVMLAGEYEFGTSTVERITLIAGKWQIKLPGETEYREWKAGQTFTVPAKAKFQLRIEQDAAYLCQFE